MFQYANRVNIAANPDKDEIAISFMQNFPAFRDEAPDENGKPKISAVLNTESVADIIVTKEFAKEVVHLLAETLK